MNEDLKFPFDAGGTILDGSHELHRIVAMSREGEEGHMDFGLSDPEFDAMWTKMTKEEKRAYLNDVLAKSKKKIDDDMASLSPRERERVEAMSEMNRRHYGIKGP